MSINPVLRMIDSDDLGSATVSELLRDLGAEHREQIAVAITRSHQFTPHAAFICLHGPHTQRFLEAIDRVRQEITLEQRYATPIKEL